MHAIEMNSINIPIYIGFSVLEIENVTQLYGY